MWTTKNINSSLSTKKKKNSSLLAVNVKKNLSQEYLCKGVGWYNLLRKCPVKVTVYS